MSLSIKKHGKWSANELAKVWQIVSWQTGIYGLYCSMLNGLDQFKEDTAMNLFGRSRMLAIAGKQCVKCGEQAIDFTDELSKKEHGISGFCQSCQDQIFG